MPLLSRVTTVEEESKWWKKGETVLELRRDGAFLTPVRDAVQEAEWRARLRMIPDHSALFVLSKFNAVVHAFSIARIKLDIEKGIYPVEHPGNEPGYRLVTLEDFAA